MRLTFSRSCRGLVLAVIMSAVPVYTADGDARLVDAAKQRNTAAIRALIRQKNIDVNVRHPDGATALLWAVQWDDLEAADLLIRAGADLRAANDLGVTPLTVAATNGSTKMIQKLLAAGADPNTAVPTGETALMTAAMAGSVEGVTLLLSAGAGVDAHESVKGQTALMWAVSEGHTDVVRTLLDHGANAKATSKSGFTPLMFAARQGDWDLANLLLAHGADVNESSADGATVLLVATVRGHVDFANSVLAKGAQPDANADKVGYTALHWAAGSRYWETATTIDFGKHGGEWFLMGGLLPERRIEMIKALLAHGADVNARVIKVPPLGKVNVPGPGPYAVIGAGPIVGATPFFLAAIAADVEIMRLLIANGADPSIAAKDGTIPVAAAAGNVYPRDTTVPESSHLAAVMLAVDLGNDVNAANNQGNTALHIATHAGFDTVVKFLVQQGAHINLKNKNGQTPLRIADGVVVITMFWTQPSTAALLRSLGATH